MGAGKSTVGRRLARRLGLPFADADEEIARAAGCSIQELFEAYGEAEFRAGERRVIARLLGEDPIVLATGGGAFMDPETRERIRERATSVWLRATLETLVDRTIGRTGRPLLKDRDPTEILDRLMKERYPTYAEAELIVDTGEGPADNVVERVIDALAAMSGSSGMETRA
jgi:shikimate kinase